MWSGPRTISTAMMRSWENRGDTFVVDEPFYAYYLKTTGLPHPMAAEIIEPVRAGEDRAPLDPRQLRRIVVPTDFSETSRGALDLARSFASSQTEILLAHVFESPMFPDGPFGALAIGMDNVET